jgi:hypothetical protein
MQTIRIGVVRGRAYHSSDGFHVYGDRGTGVMDWVHPVTPRRELFWPDAAAMAGHLLAGHVMGPHLDSVRPDGHLEGVHLLDECLMPAAAILYESDPLVFGRFRHAVVTEDAIGNATQAGVTIHETVINSEPAAARDLKPVSYDAGSHRLTLAFSPSERLVG